MTYPAKSLTRILSICIVLVCSACATPSNPEHQEAEGAQDIAIGKSYVMDSVVMGEFREVNVWLPPDYADSDKRYSVLYLMDGARDQDFHHISGLAQLATINGTFEPMIVIGIGTSNRLVELTAPATDQRYIDTAPEHGQSKKFREYISSEIIPWADQQFRTGERKVLVGESLAGLFVAETFIEHPELFTDYICVSPSLWWDDKALSKISQNRLKRHSQSSRNLYLTMADEGGTMKGGLNLLLAALETTAPAGLNWDYVDRSTTETHSSIYHEAVHQALKRFFGLPVPDYGPDPWYLIEGGQPPPREK